MNFDFFDEEPRSLKIHNNEQNIATDLLKLFSFVYYNKIPLLKNNKIRKNNYTKILKNFVLVKEPPYLDFLLDFATARHFLVHRSSVWDIDFPKIMSFFEKPDEAFQYLYEFMEERIRQDRKNRIILQTLHHLPAGKWVNFEAFYKYLITQSKSFIDPPAFFKNKYYANKQVSSNKQLTENLFAMELFWCGVVRTAFNKQQNQVTKASTKQEVIDAIAQIVNNNSLNPEQLDDLPGLETERLREIYDDLFRLTRLDFDLTSFTITPLGKALLEKKKNISTFFARKTSKFTIQPNFEIVIPPNFDERKYFKLLSFIETVRTETLNTFKITKQSVYNAILEGLTQKDLVKFLQSNSAVRVPQNVLDLVRDCFNQFNKIELYNNQYVLKASKVIIRKIEHDPKMSRFIADKLNSETILLKSKANIRTLLAKYKNLGLRVDLKR
jgi:hypothetical protein